MLCACTHQLSETARAWLAAAQAEAGGERRTGSEASAQGGQVNAVHPAAVWRRVRAELRLQPLGALCVPYGGMTLQTRTYRSALTVNRLV
eukprot:COSAG02_NODE_8305_length_2623_cov_12.854200_1_plen_90_part_00